LPGLFIWGGKTPNAQIAAGQEEKPQPEELPNVSIPGQTLIHTIEGVVEGYVQNVNLDTLIGTVTDVPYVSHVLSRTFNTGTLLLRSYTINKTFSFRSFRQSIGGGVFDPSGKPTYQIKMVYEFKEKGWNRFLRWNKTNTNRDYYYLKYSYSPYEDAEVVKTGFHSWWIVY